MFVQIKGQILSYEKTGDGMPLVFCHGNKEDHHIFDALINNLSKDFTCYALDSRGHGDSATATDYHYDDFADDLLGFCEALFLDRPIVVGFSDGAITAMLAAMKNPSFASRLVLCGPNLTPDGLERKTQKKIKKAYKKSNDPLLDLMLKEPNIDPADLEKIRCSVDLVFGEKDIITSKEQKKIIKAMPNAETHIMSGHDHSSYVIENDVLARIIRGLIV